MQWTLASSLRRNFDKTRGGMPVAAEELDWETDGDKTSADNTLEKIKRDIVHCRRNGVSRADGHKNYTGNLGRGNKGEGQATQLKIRV